MKKIIREILDDLKPKPAPANDEIKNDAPKLYEPPITGALAEPHHNEGQIVIHDGQPPAPKLETIDLDAKPQPPLPQDLNNQELSSDPAERLRQLDYQAHQNEIIQTS